LCAASAIRRVCSTFVFALGSIVFGVTARAAELTATATHENPAFAVLASRLAAGRDGYVYLVSPQYLVRFRLDGSGKVGHALGEAATGIAANRAGIIATSQAHYTHSLKLWGPDFATIGAASDFLVSDAVEWGAPSDVAAGPSGDF
jgi:hypothetical protein